jgi:hypothetical protein
MSHLKEYKSKAKSPEDRNLGDEWIDWDGHDEEIDEGKGLFLWFTFGVVLISDLFLVLLAYLITPRLASFIEELPVAAWTLAGLYVAATLFWFLELVFTVYHEKNYFLFRSKPHFLFELFFTKVIKLSHLFGVSRDRLGHSFVKVSNAVSRALKQPAPSERLLVLLPRCLTKEELKKAMDLKLRYPFEVFTVSGGELARKKLKELKPTAVIGVACERDLVSGIRDVGGRLSVIGIPNKRPHGPCKDTHIDLDALEDAIKFYVGPPRHIEQEEEPRNTAS